MVAVVRREKVALGFLLLGAFGCGSFDPVEDRRFILLDDHSYPLLQLSGAHWVAYDDQHSLRSSCTNGSAGNHEPRECSHLDRPNFKWDGAKCPPSDDQLMDSLKLPVGDNGICIQGELSALTACNNPPVQCRDAPNDVSNMWGAGVGLAFDAWNPHEHGIKGVAFDLVVFPDDTKLGGGELNLRVQIPSLLLSKDTSVEYDQPLMRDDGSVIGADGYVYGCNSSIDDSKKVPRTLEHASSSPISSELHPYGSSYWQLPTRDEDRDWGPSPITVGHNEFAWTDVAHPPGPQTYEFDDTAILGVHFQVAHPKVPQAFAYPFSFCINHLAFLE